MLGSWGLGSWGLGSDGTCTWGTPEDSAMSSIRAPHLVRGVSEANSPRAHLGPQQAYALHLAKRPHSTWLQWWRVGGPCSCKPSESLDGLPPAMEGDEQGSGVVQA